MYSLHRPDSEAFIQTLRSLLAKRGLTAEPYWPTSNLIDHWRSDDLLLSQTCGFPLMTQLPDLQLVGGFHYAAPGCEGTHYRSFIVARREELPQQFADFRGRRVVCNSADSQSGYNVLLKMITPLAADGAFFSHVLFSGSHLQSLIALKKRAADIAAIDCVTWALIKRHQPALLDGLVIIDQSPLAPGLPLVTSPLTSSQTLSLLRDALHELVSDAAHQAVCAAHGIDGFSEVRREAYRVLLDWRDDAIRRGVTRL
jgi:ABC-type phosphate/phosphonate transport system substrate-binding protein